MASKLDRETPVGAYWMNEVTGQRSMNDHLEEVRLVEGPEAIAALQMCAGDLLHMIDEEQFEEGEL